MIAAASTRNLSNDITGKFLESVCWPNPSWVFLSKAKNEVAETLIAEGEGKTGKVKELEMKNPEQGRNFEYVTKGLMDCFWTKLRV